MTARGAQALWLDYGDAAGNPKLLENLSAVASAGRCLWTASDETRTIECLEQVEDGYRLVRQVSLDALFKDLPGIETSDEADIESIDVWQGRLWMSGSHCRVRKKTDSPDLLSPRIRSRTSRRLMGFVDLKAEGGETLGKGEALAFKGDESLRRLLGRNEYIEPFIGLPSKENGLDIEGLAAFQDSLMFGLRGPLIDSFAVVVQAPLSRGLPDEKELFITHFLDLGGLGVRDITRWKRHLLILAGPVSEADGPFRMFRWKPRRSERVQVPEHLPDVEFLKDDFIEHPEGVCRLDRGEEAGLLVLYDSPKRNRIEDNRYRAEWIPLKEAQMSQKESAAPITSVAAE